MRRIILAFLFLFWASVASASGGEGQISILIDGIDRPRYHHRGSTYVEAIRGRDYSIRITNPTPFRVAVALAVDGLNTIDARHTSAREAAKWVLDPWETVEISGWQVNSETARRFVFTGERGSYGAALGKTENLGVIEAVFFRERGRPIAMYEGETQKRQRAPSPALSDDHAATGMGGRTRHDIQLVEFDLDPRPIAHVRIRYEFRPQLVRMGVIDFDPSPLERRERARGFGRFCPEP